MVSWVMKTLSKICVLCLTLFLFACQETLYSDIDEKDINAMITLLDQNGISASRQKYGDKNYSLLVEVADFSKAVKVLSEKGYPRKKFKSFGDIFSDEGLIKTPFEQRARFIFAINQELSQTLSNIDGVLSARVHVMIPEPRRFGQEKEKPTAAVMILHSQDRQIYNLIPKIKQFISHSVSGLTYDNVTVALLPKDNKDSNFNPLERKKFVEEASAQLSTENVKASLPNKYNFFLLQTKSNAYYREVLAYIFFIISFIFIAVAFLLRSRKGTK